MEEYFSIGQAAKLAGLTSETLRHYDRIGLVKPSHKDEWSKYRYYTKPDIVRLNTVHALSRMDLSLKEIREVLSYDDLGKVIAFLDEAERRADAKIRELEFGKEKIRIARAGYERKLGQTEAFRSTYTLVFPSRAILLSDTLEEPSLENLWNYLSHFYAQLPEDRREEFAFEDLAGIYQDPGLTRMFAQCQRHGEGVKILPAGTYLCADCEEDDREAAMADLKRQARKIYGADPPFAVQIIVISGILQWKYQIQVLVEEETGG